MRPRVWSSISIDSNRSAGSGFCSKTLPGSGTRGPYRRCGPAPEGVRRVPAERYASAFSRYDTEELNLLLHVDATLSLPPYAKWMRGRSDIEAWPAGPAVGCRGSRLVPTVANGSPAFGQYRPHTDGTGYEPWALQVVEFSGDRIADITAFRDTARLFPPFGLPERLERPAEG